MPLDGNRLGTVITSAIKTARPAEGAAMSDAQLEAMWRAVATAIVNEITANALVTVSTPAGQGTGGVT